MKKFNEMTKDELIKTISTLTNKKEQLKKEETSVNNINKISQLTQQLFEANEWLNGINEEEIKIMKNEYNIKDYLKDCISHVYTEPWKKQIYVEFKLFEDEIYYELEDYLKDNKFDYVFYSEDDNWMLKIVQTFNICRWYKYIDAVKKNSNSHKAVFSDVEI